MHYNLLHAYINVYRANFDNGEETNMYYNSDQVNGRHRRLFLNRFNDIYLLLLYIMIKVPNNNNKFALRNHNKTRNNIFQLR